MDAGGIERVRADAQSVIADKLRSRTRSHSTVHGAVLGQQNRDADNAAVASATAILQTVERLADIRTRIAEGVPAEETQKRLELERPSGGELSAFLIVFSAADAPYCQHADTPSSQRADTLLT